MEEYSPDDLSKGEAFDAVDAKRRRAVISILLEDGATYTLEEIGSEVANRTDAPETEDDDPDSHERVTTSLLHHHLPRLDEEGIVRFDEDARTVAPGATIDDVDPLV